MHSNLKRWQLVIDSFASPVGNEKQHGSVPFLTMEAADRVALLVGPSFCATTKPEKNWFAKLHTKGYQP